MTAWCYDELKIYKVPFEQRDYQAWQSGYCLYICVIMEMYGPFYKLSMLHQDAILNTISHTLRFTPFTVILFVCLCLSFFKVLRYQWVLLKVLYTFLFVALSPGAALAYSGCEGSFSTNNLIPNRDPQLTIPVQDT